MLARVCQYLFFFVVNPAKQPLWVILNSEYVAEEVVRTLSGSISLVLGVPIATILAAWVISRTIGKTR